VVLALLVALPVLGFLLNGLAGTLAWVVFVFVLFFLLGPAFSPRTTTWRGPYRDRDLPPGN
jgi:hypothetical protein